MLGVMMGKSKRIYVTGKVEGYTKKELRNLAEKDGYDWSSTVHTLDMLVVGERPGKKRLQTAKRHGVKTMTWDEFRKGIS
jgi:NAD-dependent DNA ligase